MPRGWDTGKCDKTVGDSIWAAKVVDSATWQTHSRPREPGGKSKKKSGPKTRLNKNNSKGFANFIILPISWTQLYTHFIWGSCVSELKNSFLQPTNTFTMPTTEFRNKAGCSHRDRKYSLVPFLCLGFSTSLTLAQGPAFQQWHLSSFPHFICLSKSEFGQFA